MLHSPRLKFTLLSPQLPWLLRKTAFASLLLCHLVFSPRSLARVFVCVSLFGSNSFKASVPLSLMLSTPASDLSLSLHPQMSSSISVCCPSLHTFSRHFSLSSAVSYQFCSLSLSFSFCPAVFPPSLPPSSLLISAHTHTHIESLCGDGDSACACRLFWVCLIVPWQIVPF